MAGRHHVQHGTRSLGGAVFVEGDYSTEILKEIKAVLVPTERAPRRADESQSGRDAEPNALQALALAASPVERRAPWI